MQRSVVLMFAISSTWAICPVSPVSAAVSTTTFEDQGLAANSFINNAGPSGQFNVNGHGFNNEYDPQWSTWDGWALSTMTDSTTPGFGNQYSAIPGSGSNGSSTYAIGFPFSFAANPLHPSDSIIELAAGTSPRSIDVTNTTYTYLSMRDGDFFSKQFEVGDYLLLDIRGFDGPGGTGNLVGTVEFYLADFVNSPGLLVDTWQTVDLSSLATAHSLRFGLRSSDIGAFGINTPTYFAVDNFEVFQVPEPSSVLLAGLGLLMLVPVARRRLGKQPGA